jgi:hypothetical protein
LSTGSVVAAAAIGPLSLSHPSCGGGCAVFSAIALDCAFLYYGLMLARSYQRAFVSLFALQLFSDGVGLGRRVDGGWWG